MKQVLSNTGHLTFFKLPRKIFLVSVCVWVWDGGFDHDPIREGFFPPKNSETWALDLEYMRGVVLNALKELAIGVGGIYLQICSAFLIWIDCDAGTNIN